MIPTQILREHCYFLTFNKNPLKKSSKSEIALLGCQAAFTKEEKETSVLLIALEWLW